MSELNLFSHVTGKAKTDLDTFTQCIEAQTYPWPDNLKINTQPNPYKQQPIFISSFVDTDDFHYIAQVVEEDAHSKRPCFWKESESLLPEDRATWRVEWAYNISPSGLVTATPNGLKSWNTNHEYKVAALLLLKKYEISTTTHQLSGQLHPFLPSLAIKTGTGTANLSPWGYASDVRAFRAALIDELHKPL